MAENKKHFFVEHEHEMLTFWEENQCFDKLREKNKNGPMFRFIDGPITANNSMGIHHAWGRSTKDVFIRYHTQRGYNCRFQNGFDAQGLWVEVEVEKALGFETKRDIEAYGMDKFTEKCKERVVHYSDIITQQSKRLGQWMDWENSYYTHTDENIEGIWYFLKKCHENGWLHQEHRCMTWCPRCGTSLSEHEMTGSYRQMTHNSVFFKLPIVEDGRKMLAWTTTPWTLSSNVALAVNPEIDYAEVRVKSDDALLVLAKNAIKHLGDDKLEVVRVFKGTELAGLHYETCFPEFSAQKNVEHKIVPWADVDAAEGVGVVHIAPGCGQEDYELGQSLGLPPIMPVDDLGIFLDGFGFLSGKDSHEIADEVFEALKQRGKLYRVEPHEHSYPVCWRCKSEVIFRLVPAWYLATEELKPRLIRAAESVTWEPASGGKRMVDWLNNMGDWNISRKRYYGMPLPFYPCDCGHLTVVGSKQELRDLGGAAVDKLPELHRPWVDDVKITCPKCGKPVQRVSEIGDVWLDAGIVPFSTLHYFDDKEYWNANFPAEWITEMSEQIRLWFYSMLFMSVVLEDRAPYERVLSFSPVVQEDGSKFSKSGFKIEFDEAAERMGADTIRYMYAGTPYTNDVRFGYTLGEEARRKLLSFWNIYTFFDTYAAIDRPIFENYTLDQAALTPTDRWLILRTNDFIEKATQYMDAYKSFQLVREFEVLVDDISNWYIRTNRRRFWKAEDNADKMVAYYTLFFALNSTMRVMAPIIPFMTEYLWQHLTRKVLPSSEISIHLGGWPQKMEGIRDDGIMQQTALTRDVITTAMRLRNEQQLKVRQPLQTLYLCCDAQTQNALQVFEKNILDELNIKEVTYIADMAPVMDAYLSVNFKAAGAVLKQDINRFKTALEQLDTGHMQQLVEQFSAGSVSVPGWDTAFDASLFQLQQRPKPGIISAQCTDNLALALDTNLTDALRKEGAVRDIIRQCQVLRKDAGYSVEQRIVAALSTKDAFLLEALTQLQEHVATELLAKDVHLNGKLEAADIEREISVADTTVTIAIAKA